MVEKQKKHDRKENEKKKNRMTRMVERRMGRETKE